VLQRLLLRCVFFSKFNITSFISFGKDMSEVILNSVKKTNGVRASAAQRGRVANLFKEVFHQCL
jgi:hypothetical protein